MAQVAPIVPFVRELREGAVGSDVVAVKRALSRAGYIRWAEGGEFTRVWGPYAAQALKNFERAKSLKQTGVYSFSRHEALRKSHRRGSTVEWAFDAHAIAILRGEVISPWERVADRVVSAVDQAILARDRIGYSQARPHPDLSPYPNLPHVTDCSGFVTWALRSGGCPDPNGMVGGAYWKYGFTGSLWAHNPSVASLANAKVCDLIFYGLPWQAGSSAHVAIVRHIRDGVVYVGSHGSTSGPLNLPATYRKVVGIRRPDLGV